MSDRVDPSSMVHAGPVRTDDWPIQATDAIVKVVGTAHDKITGPVTTVAKGLAYGLLAVILGLSAFTLTLIMLLRFVNVYLPDALFGDDHMWATYLVVGAPFVAVGVFLLAQTRRPPERDD